MLCLTLEELYAAAAKEAQAASGKLYGKGHPKVQENLPEAIPEDRQTRAKLGKAAGASGRTIASPTRMEPTFL